MLSNYALKMEDQNQDLGSMSTNQRVGELGLSLFFFFPLILSSEDYISVKSIQELNLGRESYLHIMFLNE